MAVSAFAYSDVEDFILVDLPADSPQSIGTVATLQKSEPSSRIAVYSLTSPGGAVVSVIRVERSTVRILSDS